MKVLLTLFVIMAPGEQPRMAAPIEVESISECAKQVEAFLKNQQMLTFPVRGAGCIVTNEQKDG